MPCSKLPPKLAHWKVTQPQPPVLLTRTPSLLHDQGNMEKHPPALMRRQHLQQKKQAWMQRAQHLLHLSRRVCHQTMKQLHL